MHRWFFLIIGMVALAPGCEAGSGTKVGSGDGDRGSGEAQDSGSGDTSGGGLESDSSDVWDLDCSPDGLCAKGLECVDGQCVPGGECGTTEFGISRVKPNFIVILDRSCSMGPTKWIPAVEVITALATTYEEDIRFGLALFPDGMGGGDSGWHQTCGMDTSGSITVPVGDGTTDEIVTILTNALDSGDYYSPQNDEIGCQTNTYAAINQAAMDPALADPDRSTYFMLITDGEATCTSHTLGGDVSDINFLLETLYNERGITTSVVGFGDGVDADALAAHAVSGGTADPMEPTFFQANDQEGLIDATSQITGKIISCEYWLGEEKPDDEIYVFFNDKDQIFQDTDHKGGWDYSGQTNTVTFYGADCETIKSAPDDFDIDIVFGCPAPVLE